MTTPQATIQLAVSHHQAGNLKEAESLYRQLLAQDPANSDVILLLGALMLQSGQSASSLELIQQAIAINPSVPDYYGYLGMAFNSLGHRDEAEAAYRRAIELRPDYAQAWNNLANLFRDRGDHEHAVALFQKALAIRPDYAEAMGNMANSLRDLGRTDEAESHYRRALALRPNMPVNHYNLANAMCDRGQFEHAIALYREAIRLDPRLPEAHLNLANALREVGLIPEALAEHQTSLTLAPESPEGWYAFAYTLRKAGQLDQAIAAYEKAIARRPNYSDALTNLGVLLKEASRFDEADACYRRALAADPNNAIAASNIVCMHQFRADYTPQMIYDGVRDWNRRHAAPLAHLIRPHENERSPDRRLRIGYVSPDFRDHVVGRNILPLLREHDRSQFEIFCYSNHISEDRMTSRMKACSDHWRQIAGASPDRVATLIRQDQIDILVDLSLHTAQNRLLVFARKPAPIQVTFGGYPGGTGMDAMDYRLTDPWLDPPESDWQYVEQSIRLPESFWCYDTEGMSLADAPPLNELPALASGHMTFGNLNNLGKINDGVLALWRRVLDAVPGSRLRLLMPSHDHQRRLCDKMNGRIDFVHRRPRLQYLSLYHQIDLGLDTFPYNGHTTSLDSLWMGVPVVTLVGNTAVSRAGLSQLSNLNLSELAARTPDEFVSLATTLAGDPPRLAQLRSTLRDRMKASPLMDAPRFARNIESAYRQMWHHWSRS